MARKLLTIRVKNIRVKKCLKCGHRVVLNKGFFLCDPCRKSNSQLADLGNVCQSYLAEALRIFRLGQQG